MAYVMKSTLFLQNLGVFQAGETSVSSSGKILLQGFDQIPNQNRSTGSTTITISSAKLAILRTSCGEKYSSISSKFSNLCGNDGIVARFGFQVIPVSPTTVEPPDIVLLTRPNLWHVFSVAHLILQYKPQFRFKRLPNDINHQKEGSFSF